MKITDADPDWHKIVGTERVAFRSRTSETYVRIRDDVINGTLKPGLKLRIEQLCDHYKVGGTPVREALTRLAGDGLLVREDQKGFRVSEIGLDEFDELLRMRATVEERALRLSIERGGKEWEEHVVLARYRLLNMTDGARRESRHREFHLSLVSACGSQLLLRLCQQLHDENTRYRCVARVGGMYLRDDEHEQIAEATLARQSDRAVQLLVEHYRATGRILRSFFLAGSEQEPATPAEQGAE